MTSSLHRLCGAAAMVAIGIAVSKPALAACSGTTDENKAIVTALINDVLNTDDTDALEAYVAPDYVDHSADPLLPAGPDGARIVQSAMRTAFPDLQLAIQDQVADGDLVATRVVLYGTNSGPFMGAEPTGNPMLVRAMRFDRVCDGMITEHWMVVDGAELSAQLRTDSGVTD